ncbi:dipeptidyl-peptidase 3 family protein [Mangrovibacterium diazotrophicum]|uniref:Peptidase M49-like protein n=1 Tax=Mangrovibacterium diazotrophicum TaxID=1261403 RepID=A0A419VWL2_9BACT|nr:Zn-dependent hydrolase [Mangrovibacterium diazotrophicum]RKD86498.1 peptidase M49-like protein [Mangrovibacterium diazotrophicum]
MKNLRFVCLGIIALLLAACSSSSKNETSMVNEIEKKADAFTPVKLTTDLSVLTEKEKQMLPLLFKAAQIMDDLFWMEAYGDKNEILAKSTSDAMTKFLKINYGPWERLNGNEPFMEGVGPKPKGASFYPTDMTKEEFESWSDSAKSSLYTIIERDSVGQLVSVPYHVAFQPQIEQAASYLRQAAELAEDAGLKNYLELRAEALLTDDYFESDMAWLDMKSNTIDFVVGPIESYEDQLFGYKASHEAFILVKDKEWSDRLAKFALLLPELQKALPCDAPYKSEMPGSDSDLNAYDVIYYAGDCNAGSKTIAINLPNDEQVRAEKGSRKLQLKNAMQAKFDKILVPISNLLIAEDQRQHVKFDAFFENTMFHEVAHGLGLGNTIDGTKTVRQALRDTYSSLEEGKADILGLWVVYKLNEMGELGEKDMMDNFVTFMAGIFRSVRFGGVSAHGKANMIRFYYFQEQGAFERDEETGTYRVNYEKMKEAMMKLSDLLLTVQGNGDYAHAQELISKMGFVREDLQRDLDRVNSAGIPVDIVFEQGPEVVGL